MTDDIASGQAAAEPSALPIFMLRPEGLLTDRGTRGSNKAGPVLVTPTSVNDRRGVCLWCFVCRAYLFCGLIGLISNSARYSPYITCRVGELVPGREEVRSTRWRLVAGTLIWPLVDSCLPPMGSVPLSCVGLVPIQQPSRRLHCAARAECTGEECSALCWKGPPIAGEIIRNRGPSSSFPKRLVIAVALSC